MNEIFCFESMLFIETKTLFRKRIFNLKYILNNEQPTKSFCQIITGTYHEQYEQNIFQVNDSEQTSSWIDSLAIGIILNTKIYT